MKIKEIMDLVENSSKYQNWRKDNQNNYLAHIFIMFDNDKLMDKQIGYYNPEKGTMTSFSISGQDITLIPEAEVLKKSADEDVLELKLDGVSIDFEDAEDKAAKILKEKYSKTASKKIYILQNINDSQIWNITFLSNDYSTVNIRIDSNDGNIIKDELINIIDFQNSGNKN